MPTQSIAIRHPSTLSRIWNAPVTFWLLLALPGIPMIAELVGGEFRRLLDPSGEFAARFMIISMMITPLLMLLPKSRIMHWLMKRRRSIGVAAFAYAALHTLAYVLHEGTLARILAELPQAGIWTGWLAMLIFVPLAVTSNEWSLRWLGIAWKNVQRFVYPAALLTLVHWVLVSRGLGGIIVHFLPLALLTLYRIGRNFKWWSFRFA